MSKQAPLGSKHNPIEHNIRWKDYDQYGNLVYYINYTGGNPAGVSLSSDQTISGKKTFTTIPEAPTAGVRDSSNKLATTEYVDRALINAGMGTDADYVSMSTDQTITAEKTFTKSPIVPTVDDGDNSDKSASTKYVEVAASRIAESKINNSIIVVRNVSVPPESWIADTEYPDYPYAVSIAIDKVTINSIPQINFSLADSISGVLAPLAITGHGFVKLYALSKPLTDVVIDSMLFISCCSDSEEPDIDPDDSADDSF